LLRVSRPSLRSASFQLPSSSNPLFQSTNRAFGSKLSSWRSIPVTAAPAATLTGRRSYSSNASAAENNASAANGSSKDIGKKEEGSASMSGANDVVDSLKKDVEAKNKEIIDLKDKYLRSVADYRNLQERTKRETQAARDFALQKFVKDLLQSLDNLEHALLSVSSEKLASPGHASVEALHSDLVNLHKGLQLTDGVLLGTLKRHGVTQFDPAKDGEKFDPNRHEAVFQSPMEGKEDDLVFHTQQKGYLLNGRVLRAAQVGVVKNSS